MNRRMKQLRKSLDLSQEEFGKKLNLSKPTISALENATRPITDRVVSDICRNFNVNEIWLRNGSGEVFETSNVLLLSDLIQTYALDETEQEIVMTYLKLPITQRKLIKSFLHTVVTSDILNAQQSREKVGFETEVLKQIDTKVEKYRQELEVEAKGGGELSVLQTQNGA